MTCDCGEHAGGQRLNGEHKWWCCSNNGRLEAKRLDAGYLRAIKISRTGVEIRDLLRHVRHLEKEIERLATMAEASEPYRREVERATRYDLACETIERAFAGPSASAEVLLARVHGWAERVKEASTPKD